MKKKIIGLLVVLFTLLLIGCGQKLSRSEAKNKLESSGLGMVETIKLDRFNNKEITDDAFDRTKEILDILVKNGFIKITPIMQVQYFNEPVVTIRRGPSGVWTVDPSPEAKFFSISPMSDEERHLEQSQDGLWLCYNKDGQELNGPIKLTKYDVFLNNSNNRDLELKDNTLRINTIKYSDITITGIIENSPTVNLVQYTAKGIATPEGKVLGIGDSIKEGEIKFMRFDDGWRPVL